MENHIIICSGATTSFLDLCLYLIEKFGYEELAAICRKALLMEPRRIQSPYFIFDFQRYHRDNTVKEAQCYMEKNSSNAISMEALASNLGISSRHFLRRFKKTLRVIRRYNTFNESALKPPNRNWKKQGSQSTKPHKTSVMKTLIRFTNCLKRISKSIFPPFKAVAELRFAEQRFNSAPSGLRLPDNSV